MIKCKNCTLNQHNCICKQVDRFFKENQHLMENKQKEKSKCLACWFEDCKCKQGLRNKKQ